ncbi:UPF0746 protein DDB_G0281095-like [Papaver somniferum]|uniref:UPF0746 protein DDB_G0281095-like n=1 Tax=Papaver somniferum TaxID=3469 RepID=UPI000E6FF33F|nr:UPF0746 protein DDB_G0281095-like [Papaver somniferum]
MGAACVRPIQHDQTKPFIGHQNAYQVQPLRNQRTPLNSGSGNQNLSLTQLEQQLKQQQQQREQQQQKREQQQREEQQREQQQREEQQREQQQREEQQREQQEQLQLQQQQQLLEQERQQQEREEQQREQQEQLQLQQQQQQLEQERQQQEQQQLQQQQPPEQQFLPVTDAGSLNQTFELSDNLKSTTDKVPATDCHKETQVDSPKAIKRCDSLIDDDNYCPTCFYGYESNNPKIPTQCHHHYHLSCILEWMERSPTCPVCGQVMIIL